MFALVVVLVVVSLLAVAWAMPGKERRTLKAGGPYDPFDPRNPFDSRRMR